MRIKKTKGTHGFQPEMAEQYAVEKDFGGSGFNSAARQGLCLFRLKVKAQIDPDMMLPMNIAQISKDVELGKLRSKFERRIEIRGRLLRALMNLYGGHR